MNDLLSKWIQRHQAGEVSLAVNFYQDYLKKHPNNIDILQLLGIGLCQLESFEQALSVFEKARKLDPDHPAINNNIGHIFIKQKQFEQGLDYFNQILVQQPTHLGALYNLGLLHYHQQSFAEAEPFFFQATQWYDTEIDVFYTLGLCQFYQNKIKSAHRSFKKALSLAPQDRRIYQKLGECALQLETYDDAISFFNTVNEMEPSFAAFHGLGCAYLGNDAMDEALKFFNKAYDIEPFNFENCHNIASIHFHQHALLDALQCWFQCLEMQPNSCETLYNIAVVYQYQNKFSDARDYFFKVLKLDENHHDALFNLGTLALKQNKPKDAITYYERVLSINPNNEEVQFLLTALGAHTHVTFTHCPKNYVSHLFNDYAPHYDQHLTQVLRYDGHSQLHGFIEDVLEPKRGEWSTIVDLGCGTGLAAPLLAPWCKELIGVDCADRMLAVARNQGYYHELIHGFIPDFTWPTQVGLFFLADCIPYIGDLKPMLSQLTQSLIPKGYVAFSIEKSAQSSPFQLVQSGRYQHQQDAIITLMQDHHYKLIQSKSTHLRYEQHQPVQSELFIFQRN